YSPATALAFCACAAGAARQAVAIDAATMRPARLVMAAIPKGGTLRHGPDKAKSAHYIFGQRVGGIAMCRNIKTLFNFEPPASDDEIRASALQFVRKLSGFNKPSHANEAAFALAVEEVSAAAHKLLSSLHTHAQPRDRDVEAEKARARARERFA